MPFGLPYKQSRQLSTCTQVDIYYLKHSVPPAVSCKRKFPGKTAYAPYALEPSSLFLSTSWLRHDHFMLIVIHLVSPPTPPKHAMRLYKAADQKMGACN